MSQRRKDGGEVTIDRFFRYPKIKWPHTAPDTPYPRDNATNAQADKSAKALVCWEETKLVKGRNETVKRLLNQK